MAVIYHITTAPEWETTLETDSYRPLSLETEGFIHCSDAAQVQGVLNRYFKGKSNLVQLVIDTDLLEHPLKYEFSKTAGEAFPHIYGPLNMDAILAVVTLSDEAR